MTRLEILGVVLFALGAFVLFVVMMIEFKKWSDEIEEFKKGQREYERELNALIKKRKEEAEKTRTH